MAPPLEKNPSYGARSSSVPRWKRRADCMAAGQRPCAETDAQLDDARVLIAVGGNGQGKLDRPIVAIDVKDDVFDPASPRNDEIDVLDGDVVLCQPGPRLGDESRERGDALDAPARRVLQFGLADE
jgi:hypothetical protein